ncbi:hypothetical protein OAL25_00505 [bacterium]|nr:hypothetical protein [bacterium]
MSNIKTCLVALSITTMATTGSGQSNDTPINGTVQSRCVIQTDTPGTYGNPNAYELSTKATAGGDNAVIRVDVTLADSYYVNITAPDEFATSPTLPDTVTWTGDTTVKTLSDATGMSAYESSKQELGMTDKYDLTATGSTWFETESVATLGGSRAFPGGNYTALVEAECIAK